MKEIKNMKKEAVVLSDNKLEKVAAGTDTDSLRTSGKPIPLPEARPKKESDGGYAGNVVPDLPNV